MGLKIDMWYSDDEKDVARIDCYFNDLDCHYSGNLYNKDNKCIGDFVADTLQEVEERFNWLKFRELY